MVELDEMNNVSFGHLEHILSNPLVEKFHVIIIYYYHHVISFSSILENKA